MAIVGIVLTNIQCSYGFEKEVTLEWLVFSDTARDYAAAIVEQGATYDMISPDGYANGWLPVGTPYQLGDESLADCYAGPIEVIERKIIGGTGDFEINGLTLTPKFNTKPKILYKVRQQYSSENDEQEEIGDEPSEDDPFTVRVGVEWEDLPFLHDMIDFNISVMNSAGDRFNPPAIRRRKIPVFSVTRREIPNPVGKVYAYSNYINADMLGGFIPPRTLLMDSISPEFDGKTWRVTYNIKEKPEGWQTDILDTGFYQRGGNGLLYTILNDDGTPASEPAKLNGLGQKIPDQSLPGVSVGPFYKYPEKPFGPLFLPNFYTVRSSIPSGSRMPSGYREATAEEIDDLFQ